MVVRTHIVGCDRTQGTSQDSIEYSNSQSIMTSINEILPTKFQMTLFWSQKQNIKICGLVGGVRIVVRRKGTLQWNNKDTI